MSKPLAFWRIGLHFRLYLFGLALLFLLLPPPIYVPETKAPQTGCLRPVMASDLPPANHQAEYYQVNTNGYEPIVFVASTETDKLLRVYHENVMLLEIVAGVLFILIWLTIMLSKSRYKMARVLKDQVALLVTIHEKEKQYRNLVESLGEVVFTMDAAGVFIYISPQIEKITGYSAQEVVNHKVTDLVHYGDVEGVCQQIELVADPDLRSFEFRLITKEGSMKDVHISLQRHYGESGRTKFTGIMSDITDKKRSESRLKVYATYDNLTGLYNRRVGINILEEKRQAAIRDQKDLTVCFIDINDLKLINDHHGHQEGDRVLKTVATAIRGLVRDVDVVCRMGGDEFLVILPDCGIDNAQQICSRFRTCFEALNRQQDQPYKISVSYGLAQLDIGKLQSLDELISIADHNMYQDKMRIKSGHHFD